MERIIYSKKYPRFDNEEFRKKFAQFMKNNEEREPEKSAEEFFEDIRKNTSYKPIPGRAEKKELFIRAAKDYSMKNELSVEITESEASVFVKFSTDSSMLLFGYLHKMADAITIFTHGDEVTVIMEYYTQLQFLHGRLVTQLYKR